MQLCKCSLIWFAKMHLPKLTLAKCTWACFFKHHIFWHCNFDTARLNTARFDTYCLTLRVLKLCVLTLATNPSLYCLPLISLLADGHWQSWESWSDCAVSGAAAVNTSSSSGNITGCASSRSRECGSPKLGGEEVCPGVGPGNEAVPCPCPGECLLSKWECVTDDFFHFKTYITS